MPSVDPQKNKRDRSQDDNSKRKKAKADDNDERYTIRKNLPMPKSFYSVTEFSTMRNETGKQARVERDEYKRWLGICNAALDSLPKNYEGKQPPNPEAPMPRQPRSKSYKHLELFREQEDKLVILSEKERKFFDKMKRMCLDDSKILNVFFAFAGQEPECEEFFRDLQQTEQLEMAGRLPSSAETFEVRSLEEILAEEMGEYTLPGSQDDGSFGPVT
eukprot:gene976-1153_t